MKKICFLFLLTYSTFATAYAQQKVAAIPTMDKKAIEATVLKMFAGMRASDSAMVRSVLAPGARLVSVGSARTGI